MSSDSDSADLANEIRGKMIVHWNYRGLTQLPDAIRACASDIREIYLKENKLTNLPQWMTELVNVTHLYLNGNGLRNVPLELVSMAHLTLLDLSENNLSCLPSCIGDLRSLEFLTVDNNFLKKLPLELQRLKDLQSLSVCNNEFVVLPEWLGSFEKLEQLRVDNNSLEEIPNRLTLAPGLCVLSVSSNRLYIAFWDGGITIKLPRQLLKVHDIDVNTPASLWEMALRRIYCDRDKELRSEHHDRMSQGLSYNLLVNGPIAVCTNDNCREAIFTEAWLMAAVSQQDSLSAPVPIVILYCSQNCALNFDSLCAELNAVRWHFNHK